MEQAEVTVEIEQDGVVVVKLQQRNLELNLRGSAAEFDGLSRLPSADWTRRQSIQAGQCSGSKVWWSSDAKSVSLMIGSDDEAWDLAVLYPTGIGSLVTTAVRTELTALAEQVMHSADRNEHKQDLGLATLSRALPHPQVSDLLFWPNQVAGFDTPHTPERVIDFALAYRPIEL